MCETSWILFLFQKHLLQTVPVFNANFNLWRNLCISVLETWQMSLRNGAARLSKLKPQTQLIVIRVAEKKHRCELPRKNSLTSIHPPENHKHFYEMEPFLERIKRESEKHISQEYLVSFLHVSQLFSRSRKFPVICVKQIPYFEMPVLQSECNMHRSLCPYL